MRSLAAGARYGTAMALRRRPRGGASTPGADTAATPAATPAGAPPAPPAAPAPPSGGGPADALTAATPPVPLGQRPLVRIGALSWSLIGVAVLAVGAAIVLGALTVVVVPLVLALFPAAVLVPPADALKRRGVPDAAAALIVLVGAIALFVLLFRVLTPSVAAELEGLADSLERGYGQVRSYLRSGPLGLDPVPVDALIERVRAQASDDAGELGPRLVEAGVVLVEGFAGLVLGLFALFFYLKDGSRIAGWLRDLFPERIRADVQACGDRVWFTIGAYIRGLLLIGLVDAVVIGIGLVVLRVPLALPLSVLVFFGALFPIVGAFLAGSVAVLVALATNGPGAAIAVLLLIVAVQQVEGHVLAPILLGRATELHPLAVIAALSAGAVLLGVLGAFLSVPIAASAARVVGYVRERVPG